MQEMGDQAPSNYVGLQVRADESFPRSCVRCNRSFSDLDDFVVRTHPIFGASGLIERADTVDGTIVLLMRNCACGNSLALRCDDRRDGSEKGTFRRRRFDTMVTLLVEAGVSAPTARAELRRMLHA